MKNSFLLLIILAIGCTKVAPRMPINPKPSTTLLSETVERSKAMNAIEEAKIFDFIAKDSLNTYIDSKNGFWYSYQNKNGKNVNTPKKGNIVFFEYEIYDLGGNLLYEKELLGIKKYVIDKEDIITGLQKGIKLMKEGETITFVIPFYNAYGIRGDGNKIGIKQSISCKVTLLKIKNNEQ